MAGCQLAQFSPTPRLSPAGGREARKPRRGRGWGEGGFVLLASWLQIAAPALAADGDLASLHATWFVPRAAAFVQASQPLAPAIESLCAASPDTAPAALDLARKQWLASLAAWERLSAVAIGPVLERRAQRQIDFTPTRPRLIEKAIKAAPANAKDMELIGTPAKGLPALEWLLWVKPIQPASPECRYAVQVALDIGREAEALASTRPHPQDAQAALGELLNQWIGGLERLRWASLEMPQRVAMTAHRATPDFPRQASGGTAVAWAGQWDALRGLATAGLEPALRGRGGAALADRLVQALKRADAALAGLDGRNRERVLAAGQALADLKRLAEGEVATALGVSIGFSDSDGD
jgi:predicted lipoprotein